MKAKTSFFALHCTRFSLSLPDGEDKMHLGNESKNFVFCFALHSVFIIFANQKQNHATSRTL